MSSDDERDETPDDVNAGNRAAWMAFSTVAGLGAGFAATRGAGVIWRAATGKKAPKNPADPTVSWGEAILWAVASGAFAELTRVLANRAATQYWVNATGGLPPGMTPNADD